MKKAADMLYLLAAFGVRTNMIEKASSYSKAGHKLFPQDCRLVEIHAYIQLLLGDYEAASTTLNTTEQSTPNLEFLRARVGILLDQPHEERRKHLQNYLAF